MNISLTKRHEEFVEELLNSGHYANKSEVIRAGLRLLESQTKFDLHIQAGINRGLADLEAGRVSDFDAEELKSEGRRKLAANISK